VNRLPTGPTDATFGAPAARIFEEAVRLHQAGCLAEAAQRGEETLRREPAHHGARQLLGALHVQHGKIETGLALLAAAVAAKPEDPEARNNFGVALQAAGRHAEAAAEYEKALKRRPGYAVALNNLGSALDALGRGEEAIARYRKAIAIDPRYAAACNNLGAALLKQGRGEEAVAEFRRALALRADFAEARLNLGKTLNLGKRHEEAAAVFHDAVARQPDSPYAHLGLGRALTALDQYRQAIKCLREAVRLGPELAAAHAALGSALRDLGETQEASECFEAALRLEPRQPGHFLDRVMVKPVALDDERFAAMLALAEEQASLSADAQEVLHFGLATVFKDAGENERGFAHLLRANALQRRRKPYEEPTRLALMRRIGEVFTPEVIRRARSAQDFGPRPIFIVGMPRSGSTLIEQILAAHPSVFAAGELEAFRDTLVERAAVYPDGVPLFTESDLAQIARSYLERLRQVVRRRAADGGWRGGQPICITDKMPGNFGYVGLIRMALPQARVIHTVRDPIDTCLSCFALRLEEQPFASDLRELGRYYRAYAEVMRHWRTVLPPDAILDARYELVVDDLEGQARRIVAFCGLEWDEACLRFTGASRPVKTASAAQVRQSLYRSSVGRWRPSDEVLRPLLEGLGVSDAGLATATAG